MTQSTDQYVKCRDQPEEVDMLDKPDSVFEVVRQVLAKHFAMDPPQHSNQLQREHWCNDWIEQGMKLKHPLRCGHSRDVARIEICVLLSDLAAKVKGL
jgi:hypothetical protein